MNEREERYADDLAANRAMLDEVSRAFRGQGCEPTFKSEGERLRYWKAKSALLRYLYDGKAEDIVGAESKVAELTRRVEDKKEIAAEVIRQLREQRPQAESEALSIDSSMMLLFIRDRRSSEWTAAQWAEVLHVSASGIKGTRMWKAFIKARAGDYQAIVELLDEFEGGSDGRSAGPSGQETSRSK